MTNRFGTGDLNSAPVERGDASTDKPPINATASEWLTWFADRLDSHHRLPTRPRPDPPRRLDPRLPAPRLPPPRDIEKTRPRRQVERQRRREERKERRQRREEVGHVKFHYQETCTPKNN